MPTDDAPPTVGRDVLRGVTLVLLGVLLAAAMWFLFATPTGRAVRENPREAAADVRRVVADHPAEASAVFVAAYVAFAVLCLPVWWLQVFAGVAFGLWSGGGLSLLGSAVGAAITAALADWFAGDWFHSRVEGKLARLRWLDETLGHNGLLVVMSVRLTHVIPFGLSNIALGLSRVSRRDVLLGTLLGNVPAVAVYVGVGVVNVVLLVPLLLRYLRPGWFKQFGVE